MGNFLPSTEGQRQEILKTVGVFVRGGALSRNSRRSSQKSRRCDRVHAEGRFRSLKRLHS